jgi:hypothetical protein
MTSLSWQQARRLDALTRRVIAEADSMGMTAMSWVSESCGFRYDIAVMVLSIAL